MAGPISKDRVRQTATTTGTGTFSLDVTVPTGARSFASGVGNGNTCYYCISHQTLGEWEVGYGTVATGTPDTLARTTVLDSSNSGSAVSFSGGTKDVFLVAPAKYGLPTALNSTYTLQRSDDSLNSSTAGNARGNSSVDLQLVRTAADKVASGDRAVLAGGKNNIVSGSEAVVVGGLLNVASALRAAVLGGGYNQATQNYAVVAGGTSNTAGAVKATVVGGGYNTANAGYAVVLAGYRNVASGKAATVLAGGRNNASGYHSVSTGLQANASLFGQIAHSAGLFNSNGDAQTGQYVLRKSTTDGTQSEMFLNGSSSRLVVPNDTTWAFEIIISARRGDADNESAGYLVTGVIDRNTNAASTAIVGSVTKTVLAEDTAAWDVSVDADTTNGSLRLQVTGEAAKTIYWVAFVRTVEVTG